MESCQEENKIRVTWDDTIKNCYVYLHYTKDTEKLFYVGIGTHDLIQYHSKYTRAMQCAACSRNYLWRRYYLKHGRRVEIYKDNLTEKEAKELEIYLIDKYGRIIDNSGILCNISAGGEGRFKDNSNNKKIYVYNLQGILINSFDSCKAAAIYYGLDRRNVGMAANMKRKTCGDYQFRYEYNKDLNLINLNSSLRKKAKPIICTNSNTGQVLKFSSSYKFAKFLGVSSNAHILDVLNNKRSNIKGWEVEYDL